MENKTKCIYCEIIRKKLPIAVKKAKSTETEGLTKFLLDFLKHKKDSV